MGPPRGRLAMVPVHWGCVPTPNCVTRLCGNTLLQITSSRVGKVRTGAAFANNDHCLRRRTKEPRVRLHQKQRETWNQHSLELRGVSSNQGGGSFPLCSPSFMLTLNQPTNGAGHSERGKGSGWYVSDTGELRNKVCT